MHPDVVRVGIALLVVAIGDDHLRAYAADLGHEALDGLLERAGGECTRIGVRLRARHARVAVAEQDDLVVADDLGGPVQLAATDPGDVGANLRGVHDGVEDVAFLTTGAGHQDGADTCGMVFRDGPGTLGGLVVGMRVHAQDAGLIVHGWPP